MFKMPWVNAFLYPPAAQSAPVGECVGVRFMARAELEIDENDQTEVVAPGDGHSFKILVLEDSTFDQVRIRRACEDTGLPVATTLCSNISDFQIALDGQSFDLVLVDYNLPDGDGLTAQRAVQNHGQNFAAPVVMMSSELQTDVAVQSLKLGSLDCLDKDAIDAQRLKDLMLTAARVFSEASKRWITELLAQHRKEIAQDFAAMLRNELEFGRLVDLIDAQIGQKMALRGLVDADSSGLKQMFSDEPFDFS